MMIEPGCKVYRGMIVGEHTRGQRPRDQRPQGKQLTNIRTTSKDEAVRLTPRSRCRWKRRWPISRDDELVEVTPKSIRLRKKFLGRQRPQARGKSQASGGVRKKAMAGSE